ncbi:hypothetical protein GQ600_21009 [Phytophthora cactorum]|nr:hypothetical protein GQ600_21009 [Phytophthora cactorum]
MKSSIVTVFTLMASICYTATSTFTVLMYTDSRFEDYVGQVRFDSTDRCYPLSSRNAACGFEDVECQGRFIAGDKKYDVEFSAVASGRKVRSFILSTTESFTPTRGIVHSCDEKSDIVYKTFNDTDL